MTRNTRLYLLLALSATELLMSFSFLGYLHIEPISITFSYIPVLLAGCLMGPVESSVLGALFGLSSLWKASAFYVLPADQVFSPMFSSQPIQSLLLSVGTRILFGLLVGLLYAMARRFRHQTLWIALISIAGKTLHALLVYSAMALFFPELGFGPRDTLSDFFSLENLITIAVTTALVLLCWRVWNSTAFCRFLSHIQMVQGREAQHYQRLPLVVVALLSAFCAGAVGLYFLHRMSYVLRRHQVTLSEDLYYDLFHIQTQFLVGIIALMCLVIVFLIFNRMHTAYVDYVAQTDPLTGLLNREIFFRLCTRALNDSPSGSGVRYFLMLDVDRFKEINDRGGHPVGDQILQETARHLRDSFAQISLIGRLGGDEFAVFITTPIVREELEQRLELFTGRVHRINCPVGRVTCSIGTYPLERMMSMDELYRRADRLLYAAKARGRDQYVIGAQEAAAPEGTEVSPAG